MYTLWLLLKLLIRLTSKVQQLNYLMDHLGWGCSLKPELIIKLILFTMRETMYFLKYLDRFFLNYQYWGDISLL